MTGQGLYTNQWRSRTNQLGGKKRTLNDVLNAMRDTEEIEAERRMI